VLSTCAEKKVAKKSKHRRFAKEVKELASGSQISNIQTCEKKKEGGRKDEKLWKLLGKGTAERDTRRARGFEIERRANINYSRSAMLGRQK